MGKSPWTFSRPEDLQAETQGVPDGENRQEGMQERKGRIDYAMYETS